MLTKCDKCSNYYNDEYSWTICPHYSIRISHDGSNYCFRHDFYLPCDACKVELKWDDRYLTIRERLNCFSVEQLESIIDNIDNICFDTFNYDEKENKFCPLAVGLGLHEKISCPTNELVTEEIAKHFTLVNVIKGLRGRFYTLERKKDLLWLCKDLITEKIHVSATKL